MRAYPIYAGTGFYMSGQMLMFRYSKICVAALCLLAADLRSQENADELLARVQDNYLSKQNLEVTGYSRELRAVESHDAESTTPEYRAQSAVYGRLVFTWRSADDWRIVSQQEQVSRGQAQPSRTFVFGKTGEADATMLLLNASTKAPFRLSLPAEMIKQEVNERIGSAVRENALFRLLFNDRKRGRLNWAVFHGASAELTIEGTDEVDGVRLTRIVSKWPPTEVTRLWIDPETLTLVRVLVTPGEQAIRIGMPLEIKETLYRHDFAKGATDEDFDLDAGWALAQPNISAAAGFSPSADLFAVLTSGGTVKPEAPVTRAPKPPTRRLPPNIATPKPPDAGSVADTAAGEPATPVQTPLPKPTAPAVETQSLTSEQMEAIVLIEGDEGVGTGFVARIKGVDFVLTNLHVIGGNEKVSVTTVRGVKIPVGGMFGAMGRDIAILRIEGENKVPALTLAADPLKTAKLGDKVVVVGNRRGGGVATQVSGVVRGIGPDRVEVDAPFQPGNSGSPIVHLQTGEVLGVASYSQTRKLDELDGPSASTVGTATKEPAQEEQRWFGFRADAVAKWQAVDLGKWREQARRIADFEADTEAIYYAMYGRFQEAAKNSRVKALIDRFDERTMRMGSSQLAVGQEVREFFRSLHALAQTGVKELKTGDYYDFFRTSDYWETSITQQLRARADISSRLEKASADSSAFLAKLRR